MPRQTVIEVENLRKTYGPVIAVETVSLEVYKGEIFGLVGPNGAGKTTSVECIEGLRRPDAGKLRVLGLDPGRPLLQPLSTAHSGRRPAAGTLAGGKLGETYVGSRFPGRNFHRRRPDFGENVQVGIIGKRILFHNRRIKSVDTEVNMRAVLKLKPMLLLFLALGLFGITASNEERRPVPDKMRPGFDSINPVDSASFLEFIAADELEGRDTPSKGQTIARRYIQSLYKSWGVAPLGDAAGLGARSYEQRLPMIIKTYGPGTCMAVQSPNLTRAFVMGGDFSCGMGADERGSLKGGVVFAGYGISAPDLGYDDFAGIDVRDRIVLVAAGKPRGESGDTVFTNPRNWARFAGRRTPVENLARLLARKGALALVVTDDAWDEGDGPEGYHRDARIPSASNRVFSPALTAADPMTPTFWASPRIADALFEAAGRSFGDTKRLIDAGLRPASFAFSGLTMSIEVDVAHKAMSSANVLGIVEGSDPELKKEYVVIGGHLDHVGMTADGYVFHGADDNGSGSVGVLQAARAFALNPVKPRRSVIFAHWTGEEKGLLGSLAFIKFQPVPLGKVVACINLDMISHDTSPKEVRAAAEELRLGPEVTGRITNDPTKLLMAYASLPSPSFTDTIMGLSAGCVDLDVVPLPSFPMLGNSDHYFFALAGVPSVFFFTGGQADTHQPGDTADKINAKKMAEVVKLAFLTAYSVADAPDRPRWE